MSKNILVKEKLYFK